MAIACCILVLAASRAHGEETNSRTVVVSHPQAFRLTKHPTLPVLYLGCAYAPESRNLVTYRLHPDGSLVANSQRAHPDFLTDDPHKPAPEYRLLRPIVLAEEKVLLLAARPYDGARYNVASNARHLAAVSLDDEGQPLRALRTFRTTYDKSTIFTMHYDPSRRRLYLTYADGRFGWCDVGKDGVPSNPFHAVPATEQFYYYAFSPVWQRFYVAGKGVGIFQLRTDGQKLEFAQSAAGGQGSLGNIELNATMRKLYVLDGPSNDTVTIYPLTPEGRLTGVPRRSRIGKTDMLRFDFKAQRLYSLTTDGVLRSFSMDADGCPTTAPRVSRLSLRLVRDAVVDENTGRVYVAGK
jgi:hypothetical protein